MIALGVAVWKRPYLERPLAPVVVIGGAVIALYGVLPRLVGDGDGGWGAVLINALAFGGLWIVIGVLLGVASRGSELAGRSPAHHRS